MTTNPPPRNPQALPTQTPPFLTKLYQLVSDPNTQTLVSWTDEKGLSFTVHKPSEFGRDILPKYFKHNNFSSFVRQLNQYGFHKQNPDKWMFGHDSFRRDRPDLLKNITRRRPKQSQSSNAILPTALTQNAVVEIGNYGLEGELKSLKRDKDLLIKELVVTRQKEEQLKNRCEDLESRVVNLENSSKQMQAFIMHYFSQVLQPYSEAMASRKRKRLPSIDEPDTMIVEQPAHQVANISHPNGRSSVDALRVMMQQMGVGISRSPAQSQAQSPARSHAQPRISFEPATVQELPQEESLSTISPSRRIMPPKAVKTVALIRPPALTVPTFPPAPANADSSKQPHAPTSVPQTPKAPSTPLQPVPQAQRLSVPTLSHPVTPPPAPQPQGLSVPTRSQPTTPQPNAVASPGALAAAYQAASVQFSHESRSPPYPASSTAFHHTHELSHTPGLGFASIDTPMTNGVVENHNGPEKLVSCEDAHMASSDGISLGAPGQDGHRVDPDVDRALEFLEDIPSTPNTSMTMDAIDNALQEPRSQSKGTHLDTPDFDKAFDDKEFNMSFGHEPDSVKLNGHCSSSAENERVIEDFLELSADDHGLPPPLTHLPEGTDIHALAKKIESFADP